MQQHQSGANKASRIHSKSHNRMQEREREREREREGGAEGKGEEVQVAERETVLERAKFV